MPIPSNPPLLSNVLGYAADVSVIPGTTPSGSGAFSYQSAFPQITAIPLTAGGVAPMREDFNAVFKLLSQHVHFLQSGSLYTWNNALDYLKGAHILGSNGMEYIAQASSGPNVPGVGGKDPTTDDGEFWMSTQVKINGVRRGQIAPYYNVTFGGSDGRRPIFWGETEADEDYVICDGGSDGAGGNVPDLRGRMIIGASDPRPVGTTGGTEEHHHGLPTSVGARTITGEQLAVHHHPLQKFVFTSYGTGENQTFAENGDTPSTTGFAGGSQPHDHPLGGTTELSSTLPPFYSLAFVARIKK